MKNNSITRWLNRLVLSLWALTATFVAMAQDGGGGGGDANITVKTESTTSETWYTSPWVWVVGAAVFILLLVALLNNRGRRTD